MNDPTTFPLPSPLLLLSLLLPLLSIPLIYADYTTFLSLGPGGTPPTPTGYLKIKLLSLITLRNPYLPPPLPPHFRPQSGVLTPLSIPLRPGARPLVKGIAPQRQRTQRSSPGTYNLLLSELRAVVNTLTTRIPTHASTRNSPSVLRPSPHPLRILLPLPAHIPEPPSALSLPTNPRIEPQKRKRVALAQHLLSLSRPLPLTMLTLARYLSTPFSPLNWLQRRRRRDDAGGEDEDRDEELDGDVEGERGICKSCRVLVGGVDAS
ncbi:hypothetical protein GRF29_106g1654561 [Pseudopithomyces chartarum]|uniref:Uncharacterized protein n=1 Tax=Pseudopithomyces chartarum TaxID=1892770 RepID=A0AAN6LXI6_9PLEO|nr:hypothetical protein GRF29_106g1654561 [Pseudopithomyces chartarum]